MPIDPTAQVAIIGAGPCGLACARELEAQGHHAWTLYEAGSGPGGLARSMVDAAGFTWDLGGHVVFSHYGEFDRLLDEVMGADVNSHDRSSYVRAGESWVPYPFQNNLRHLPPAVRDECLEGLAGRARADVAGADRTGPERTVTPADPRNFAEWMAAVFGPGITRHFMGPYNAKVWATAPERMQFDWIAERVAVVDHARAAAAVTSGSDDLAWGPNNRFVFPVDGGTGEIYRRMAAPLAAHIRYGASLVGVDSASRTLRLGDGSRVGYDTLVSTMPLDRLVAGLEDAPAELADAAGHLVHNSVYMVGVGVRAPLSDDRSWMYFPDPDVPFYRVTNFAKYASANVPRGDTATFSSYMTETAFSPTAPVPREGLEQRVIDGLITVGLLDPAAEVVSVHVEEIPYAYPVPTLERDDALAVIQPWLEARGILSRGRFGTWRYELGNMDHAVKMGVDAARRLLIDAPEVALAG